MTTETSEKRPIQLDDLYQQKFLEDPRLSADGRWVAFVKVDLDRASNGYQRNIWLCDLADAGGQRPPLQLTRSHKDTQPRWSPDGSTLAFISARGDKPQIYLLSVAQGGEAYPLTNHPNGVSAFTWSPDGAQIAFLAAMNQDDITREDANETPPSDKLERQHLAAQREEAEKQKLDPRVITRVPYRVGTAYVTDRYAQVYVIDAQEGAKPRRLTQVATSYQTPQWSADGRYLFTARAADLEADEPYRRSRLYRLNVATGEESAFLHGDEYTDVAPVVSLDGHWLAYSRFPQDKASMRLNRLTSVLTEGGIPTDLNLTADLSPVAYRWGQDGIYFTGETFGSQRLYRVAATGGEIVPLIEGVLRVESFDLTADAQTIAYVASTPDAPQEVFVLREGVTTQITHFNQPLVDTVISQPYHHLPFTAADGQALEGWYLLPPDYEEGKQYPLLLYIHGGPHVMWGPSQPNEWYEWQNMAARGYVTFFCNPRGSGGYGEAFQMAVHAGGWSDLAYSDIMTGVDALIARGFVDTERLAVTGGSYGGYMTAWIVSHTERFKAAVAQRGVYNLLSFFGTTDIPTFVLDEFGALPLDNPTFLWEQSPLAHAHKIKTPLLILHSENDYRVPISEAEQLFGYVRRLGIETAFVRFPRDGHELTRSGEPLHRIQHLTHILDWCDQYCKC